MEGGEGFRGAIPFLERLQQKSYEVGNRFLIKQYQSRAAVHGVRRRAAAPRGAAVTLGERTIAEVSAMTVGEAAAFLRGLGSLNASARSPARCWSSSSRASASSNASISTT